MAVAVNVIPDPLDFSRDMISEFFMMGSDQVFVFLRQRFVGVHDFDRPLEFGAKTSRLKKLTYNRLTSKRLEDQTGEERI